MPSPLFFRAHFYLKIIRRTSEYEKIIAILMALTLLATACVLAGCNNHTDIQDDKLSVVTTIFPEYDWVKNILGDKADRAELTMLLDNGVDLHSYVGTTQSRN